MIKGSKASGGKKPTTPTIGSATAGNTTATVAFTASTYLGKDGTATYRAVSNPGSFTGTSSSSPIAVSGLTNGTAYTFTVRAETSYGVSSDYSSASNSVIPSNNPPTPPTPPEPPISDNYWFSELNISIMDERVCTVSGPDQLANLYSSYITADSTLTKSGFVKYDTDGNIVWQKISNIGTDEYDYFIVEDTYVDSNNYLYACGHSNFNNDANEISYAVLAKYNANGSVVWQKTLRNTSEPNQGLKFLGMNIDTEGNILAAGSTTNAGNTEIQGLLVKYDSSGEVIWQKTFFDPTDTTSVIELASVKSDSNDNIYVIGSALATSSPSSPITYWYDSILIKYDNNGSLSWYKRFRSEGSYTNSESGDVYYKSDLLDLDIDSSNNVYLVGESYENTGVTPVTPSTEPFSGVITKLNPSGTVQWRKVISNVIDNELYTVIGLTSITVDYYNNIFVVGIYGDTSNPFDDTKSMILCFNTSGTIQWQRQLYHSSGQVLINDLSTDIYGDIYLYGLHSAPVYSLFGKLPGDGSLTGNYALDYITLVYSASTLTSQSLSATLVSPDTLSDEFSNFSEDIASITYSNTSYAGDKVNL